MQKLIITTLEQNLLVLTKKACIVGILNAQERPATNMLLHKLEQELSWLLCKMAGFFSLESFVSQLL